MKNNINNFKWLGVFLMALLLASCTEFNEFESTTYGPGPTISLAQVSVQDSTFTISVTSSAAGHASVILLPGTGNAAPEDPEDLLTGNLSAMEYQSHSVRANEAYNFTFSGLVQNAVYEVMGAANNGDGKAGEVVTLAIGTDDTHAPALVSTSPEVGYTPVLTRDGTITLTFDEAVQYDDTKVMTFSRRYFRDGELVIGGEDMLAGEVDVDFNVVTITPADSLRNKEYLWLSYPEGTFIDYAENLVEEMETFYDVADDEIYGLFWRVESDVLEVVSVSPEDGALIGASSFDIEVVFDEEVDISALADGDITLSYDDGMDVFIKSVLLSEVSAVGEVLTITASISPEPGMSVTLDIPEDVIDIGIFNPNAEFSATWVAELSLPDLVGDYSVSAINLNPAYSDLMMTAVIETVPGNDSALSITLDAGAGGGIAFLATVNTDSMSILIAEDTEVGDLFGYGRLIVFGYDGTNYYGDIAGALTGANGFTMNDFTMYLPDYDWGDGTYGAIWGMYNTTWTKTATKSAISSGSTPDLIRMRR